MDFPKYIDFKESIVAFVDILGFDKRIREINSEEDFLKISDLLFALKKFANDFNQNNKFFKEFELTAISDSLIASVPFQSPISTYGLLSILHHFQYGFLATSFKTLFRGYITKGKVYHKNGIIFGHGYSDAYKTESKLKGPPRIVVSPGLISEANEVIQKAKETKDGTKFETIFEFLKLDPSDGLFFIDYLKPVGTQTKQPREELIEERSSIQKFIDEQLVSSSENIRLLQKYNWLKSYFKSSLSHLNS